jgi:hypothetical protein
MLRFGLKATLVTFLVVWLGGMGASWSGINRVGVPSSSIPESPDFATLVLHDAWDMNQYTDVSQYLNESGQRNLVTSPAVANGQFTGRSVGNAINGNTAYFFPLFPGYQGTMLVGKVGHRYPIVSSLYHCLYIAMKVDSTVNPPVNPDQFQIFWYADDTLNRPNSTWGHTYVQLFPGSENPPRYYRIYKVDLAAPPNGSAGTPWNSHATWEGLRIDPTVNAGVTFAVDWVRLTTCGSNNANITWSPDSSANFAWVNDNSANRWIRMPTNVNGSSGSAAIDVQGIPPGTYTIGLGTATTCCKQTSTSAMVIVAAPIVDFVSPSFFSGPEYASQAGTPWDFNAASDISASAHINYTIHDGVLDTIVPSGQPPATLDVDPQLFLNTPAPIHPATFRYLSFRMYTDWKAPWQNVPDGMIVRFIWGMPGTTGGPTARCWMTGHDIPFDIGWQTYWIDMGDPFNGQPQLSAPTACPATTPAWTNSPPILDLRFDPDENITAITDPIAYVGGGSFHHEIDWIRLNAIDSVAQGAPYPIQLQLKGSSQMAYYYTTNPADPTQAVARRFSPGEPSSANFRLFLPLLMTPLKNTDMGGLPATNTTYLWDTSGVPRNTYYICVRAPWGSNTATYCSEAPVVVN